jgi:hypothetical protein
MMITDDDDDDDDDDNKNRMEEFWCRKMSSYQDKLKESNDIDLIMLLILNRLS